MTLSGGSAERVQRLALDTSAYSRFRAGDVRVRDFLSAVDSVLVPVPVLGELHGAFELGSRGRENRVTLTEFLSEPFVHVTPVTISVARHYGRVFAALRRAGTPVPANDMWIAACAIDQGACLLTFDHDFERIAALDSIVLDGIEIDTEEPE
jgi:tRNA(fMet)-specific endonuclease VapC